MPKFHPFFLTLLLASTLSASVTENALTLNAVLSRVLTKSPELAPFSFEERAAEARILQAGLKPHPEASIQIEDLGSVRGRGALRESQTTLQLSQLLELGGKRQARIREAQAGKRTVHFDYEVKRLEVISEATQTFYEALGAQRRVELAEELLKMTEELGPVFRQRMEAGKASSVEATRNDLAIASAQIALQQAKGDLSSTLRRLASAWAAKEVDFHKVVGLLEQVSAPKSFGEYLTNLNANPRIARWDAEKERRKAALKKEQSEAKPDAVLSVGPRWQNSSNDATFVAGVSVPLPFRNRNEGKIREAQVSVEQADAERHAAEIRLTTELGSAYEQARKVSGEIKILTETVLPSATAALNVVIEGYTAGKLSQLEVLEARRTVADARMQHLQALVEYHKAATQLDVLCGVTLKNHAK